MVLETEERLSKKYVLGDIIDPEDEHTIDKMESVGMMHTGLSFELMSRTARTTSFGVRVFGLCFYKKRKQIERQIRNIYNQMKKDILSWNQKRT